MNLLPPNVYHILRLEGSWLSVKAFHIMAQVDNLLSTEEILIFGRNWIN